MLAPRHLIFTALEGALVDARTDSFAGAEDAVYELERRKIPWILLTARTRTEIDPIRRKLGHMHPFITENGGGIFFPDGYLSVKIPDVARVGRYLSVALGRPYAEVCEALDDIAGECGVGVTGFHHMSVREIASNTGLRPREAELAKQREFDELFYFTTGDDKAIAGFTETAQARGFQMRQEGTFWHFSAGCDPARAVRMIAQLFRDSMRTKLSLVGIGASEADLPWLQAVNQALLIPDSSAKKSHPVEGEETAGNRPAGPPRRPSRAVAVADLPGPAGWNEAILSIIS